MRISQITEDSSLEIEDSPGELITSIGEPVRFLYRIVSKEEYDDIKQSGVIKAGGFYGRIHAAVIPVGGDGSSYRALKIKYNPADGWKSKRASTGVYAVTWQDVPEDRIAETIPMSIVKTNALLKTTPISQYIEYQSR